MFSARTRLSEPAVIGIQGSEHRPRGAGQKKWSSVDVDTFLLHQCANAPAAMMHFESRLLSCCVSSSSSLST
ncbi:unnamed protein product [Amoebophrya sp. A120]|nr:unnamed protein product [Amoebophrya sp. A120]|eukprot:GSA120T00012296001.1